MKKSQPPHGLCRGVLRGTTAASSRLSPTACAIATTSGTSAFPLRRIFASARAPVGYGPLSRTLHSVPRGDAPASSWSPRGLVPPDAVRRGGPALSKGKLYRKPSALSPWPRGELSCGGLYSVKKKANGSLVTKFPERRESGAPAAMAKARGLRRRWGTMRMEESLWSALLSGGSNAYSGRGGVRTPDSACGRTAGLRSQSARGQAARCTSDGEGVSGRLVRGAHGVHWRGRSMGRPGSRVGTLKRRNVSFSFGTASLKN